MQISNPDDDAYLEARGRGGGSSPIFVRGCTTLGSRNPPFDKAPKRLNLDPHVMHSQELFAILS